MGVSRKSAGVSRVYLGSEHQALDHHGVIGSLHRSRALRRPVSRTSACESNTSRKSADVYGTSASVYMTSVGVYMTSAGVSGKSKVCLGTCRVDQYVRICG